MWYYKRAVTIDGNRIGQVYYKIYRWHKVNEETSLGYAFFYDRCAGCLISGLGICTLTTA